MSMIFNDLKENEDDFCFSGYMNALPVQKKNTDIEELKAYRAIGTVSEFRENKNFLEFLYNTILPNEMEKYLAMYHASEEKSVDWSEGKE